MRPARTHERYHVVRLLDVAFRQNPWLCALANPAERARQYRRLIEHTYARMMRRGAVWLSDDARAALLFDRCRGAEALTWRDLLGQARLALGNLRLGDVAPAIRRQRRLRALRQGAGDHLYVWLFAAQPEAARLGSARGLVRELFELADRERLPIYAETTLPQNRRVYERFGFETYAHWVDPHFRVETWGMRRGA